MKMDVPREHVSRILELREIPLSFQTGFNLISVAVVCVLSGEYLRLGTLVRYNGAHVLESCDCLKLLSVYFDLVDAAGVVCYQLLFSARTLCPDA